MVSAGSLAHPVCPCNGGQPPRTDIDGADPCLLSGHPPTGVNTPMPVERPRSRLRFMHRDTLRVPFVAESLRHGLVPPWRHLEVVDETGSTNADLIARAAAGGNIGGV